MPFIFGTKTAIMWMLKQMHWKDTSSVSIRGKKPPVMLRKKPKKHSESIKNAGSNDYAITYDVYRPKDKNTAKEAVRNIERTTLNTKGYSTANAVQAGLRDRLGFGITTNYDKNYKICSELVYDCFNGLIGNDAVSSVSPGRLAKNRHLEKVHTLRLSIEELFR